MTSEDEDSRIDFTLSEYAVRPTLVLSRLRAFFIAAVKEVML